MTRLFARHTGRHRRHGSLTGWSALSQMLPAVAFPRRRALPLGVFPLTDDDLIPFAGYRHPYNPSKDAA